MIAFRRPPSLRNLSKLRSRPLMTVPFLPSSTECLGALLDVLPARNISWESDSFKSRSTGALHKIRGHITCTTCNIIYLISCRICGTQYIGETKNSLKKHFYGHRSTIKTHKLDTPVGQHFNLPNHSISDMILQGIEALANRRESVRFSREKMWIRHVHTIHPHGLNRNFLHLFCIQIQNYMGTSFTLVRHMSIIPHGFVYTRCEGKTHVQGIFSFSRRANCELLIGRWHALPFRFNKETIESKIHHKRVHKFSENKYSF